MAESVTSVESRQHRDFYERFVSFWSAPSGQRVLEIISPDATIHFSGQGTFTGAEYVEVMAGLLTSMEGLEVTPLDYAGNGDILYIYWNSSAIIDGVRTDYRGVDRFRLSDGMAVDEHVVFDTAQLAPAG